MRAQPKIIISAQTPILCVDPLEIQKMQFFFFLSPFLNA